MARRELGPAGLRVVQAVEPWFEQAAADNAQLLLAVSGGADSLALAGATAALARRRERAGLDPVVLTGVVVDHGLQAGSAQVAQRTVQQLSRLGIAAEVSPVAVDLTSGDGLEAAARDARRRAFAAAADRLGEHRSVWVMLAHTLDDQAESVLLGLARGSGLRSLSGMSPSAPLGRHRLIRPLLTIRRADTEAACTEWGLDVWHDPHNGDERFKRSAVRHRLMPVLREVVGDHVDQNLARVASLARADADALDALARASLPTDPEPESHLDIASLSPEAALRSRQLLHWLRGHHLQLMHDHIVAISALVDDWHGQRPIDLPGAQLGRRGDELWVRRTDAGDER